LKGSVTVLDLNCKEALTTQIYEMFFFIFSRCHDLNVAFEGF